MRRLVHLQQLTDKLEKTVKNWVFQYLSIVTLGASNSPNMEPGGKTGAFALIGHQ